MTVGASKDNSCGWVPRGRIPGANPVLASRQLVDGWVDRRLADVLFRGSSNLPSCLLPILLRTETSFRAIGQGRVTVEAAILVCRNTWSIPLPFRLLEFLCYSVDLEFPPIRAVSSRRTGGPYWRPFVVQPAEP